MIPYILHRPFVLFVSLTLCARLAIAQDVKQGDPFKTLWNRVDSLEEKGLTESARALTESIRDRARKEDRPAELVKAIIHRMKFLEFREEDALARNLADLQAEIDASAFPERPLLYSMKAELLWRYYQDNRYRILDRGIAPADTVADPALWDVARFVGETHRAYRASLEYAGEAKRVQVNVFDPVIEPGSTMEARRFRPSLYDFLAHRAIDFYKNEESGLTRPIGSFTIGSAFYLNEADLFLNFLLKTEDTLSFDFQAIRLLQDLLDFHQDDTHPGAFIDVDIERLRFVYDRLTIANKDTLYLKALQLVANRYRNFPGSTDALFAIADWYTSRVCDRSETPADSCSTYRRRALAYCDEAITRFPYSQGGLNAKSMRAQLLAPELDLVVMKTQLPARSILSSIMYRNVDSVWYKIVRLDDAYFESLQREQERMNEEKRIRRYLRQSVVDEGLWVLPGSMDLNVHRVELPLPALTLGRYALLIGTTPGFSTERQAVVYADFQVTRIALRVRKPENAALEIFVSEGESGRPLPGASVRLYTELYDYRKRLYTEHEVALGTTAADGSISFPVNTEGYASRITVISGEDRLYTDGQSVYLHQGKPERRLTRRDVLFTDRSLYRPGQTVYFKALLTESADHTASIVPNTSVTIFLVDPNNESVDSLVLISSKMGSVSGRFVIPMGRMTGVWYLRTGDHSGMASIRVEEYKRPRFEVRLDPTRSTARPGDRIAITGYAKSYTGVSVQDGLVRYRVSRSARVPVWRYGWKPYIPQSASQEIAHGTLATDRSGVFHFEFDALPDPQWRAEDRPEYQYNIDVSVTDANGETRSAHSEVPVAYVPLRVDVRMSEFVGKDALAPVSVVTTNLDGQRVNANAVVRIWQLQEPQPVMRDRAWPAPDQFFLTEQSFRQRFPWDPYKDEEAPLNWATQRQVLEKTFDTSLDTILDLSLLKGLVPGWYRLECVAINAQRQEARTLHHFLLFDPSGEQVPTPEVAWFHASPKEAEPGASVRILFGSRLPEAHWLYEVEREGRISKREAIVTKGTQVIVTETVQEADRGNFTIHLSTTIAGRTYAFAHTVEVPHSDKKLDVQLETFRSALEPGKHERWRIRLRNPDASPANAELLANLYDASLDAIRPHAWQTGFFRSRAQSQFIAPFFHGPVNGQLIANRWYDIPDAGWRSYDQLNWFGYNGWSQRYFVDGIVLESVMVKSNAPGGSRPKLEDSAVPAVAAEPSAPPAPVPGSGATASPVPQPVRGNLRETAFFYPELKTDAQGDVLLEFDSPEALSRWRLMLFGHDDQLRSGYREQTVVTQKNLMVMPNLPRFFRVGDRTDLPVKVDNLFITEASVRISVELTVLDAVTREPVDARFGNTNKTQVIDVMPATSETVVFPLSIPDRSEPVIIRIVASADGNSDGEEHLLPVLSDRVLLTETKPFVVRGDSARKVQFTAMEQHTSASSKTVSFTLSYTADPVWYAVQALPYLKEYPHECAEQLFSRYFANAVSSYILRSRPALEAVFAKWRNTEPQALLAQLERNPGLKQIVLEETPWLLAARDESERKRNIALLFDLDRQRLESRATLERLRQSQNPDGSWSWFKGMRGDVYITRYIAEGIGRMNRMGVSDPYVQQELTRMSMRALDFLDEEFIRHCREQRKSAGNDTLPATIDDLHYLFVRTCFDKPTRGELDQMIDYCYKRARIQWHRLPLLSQSMLMRIAHRRGDAAQVNDLLRSLLERSLSHPDEGRWWKQDAPGYYWWSAPIEAQANLIEAFVETGVGRDTIDELKTWLLRQKQTQDWGTTRATVQACFALLQTGRDWVSHTNTATLRIAGEQIKTGQAGEAGTGLLEKSWKGDVIGRSHATLEIEPARGNTISWGALYWQYTERMDAVQSTASPFRVEKQFFAERAGNSGPVSLPLADSVRIAQGDRVLVRMILYVDRDMDYVHLVDPRVAGLEPEQVLSETVWQSGTCWFQSTRDAATHFFFPQLNKGTYVIEYSLRAFQSGEYASGPAQMQCLYAPEYAAHSSGARLQIMPR